MKRLKVLSLMFLVLFLVPFFVYEVLAQKGDGPGTTGTYQNVIAYAVASITNETHIPVYFLYKWGNGPWQEYTLDSGKHKIISFQIDATRVAKGDYWRPPLFVQFDVNNGNTVWDPTIQTLDTYVRSQIDYDQSKRYSFQHRVQWILQLLEVY